MLNFFKKPPKKEFEDIKLVSDKICSLKSEIRDLHAITSLLNDKDELLIRAKKLWEDTYNTVPDSIIIITACGYIEKFNHSAQKYYPEISEGMYFGDFCKKYLHMNVKDTTVYRAITLGQEIKIDAKIESINKIFNISSSPIFNENGEIDYIVHVSRDITRLWTIKNRLENVISASDSIYWEWIPNKKYLFLSPKWFDILGYDKRKFHITFDRFINSYVHKNEKDYVYNKIQKIIENKIGSFDLEFRILMNNGLYKWFLVRGGVSEISKNEVKLSGILIDIDERKEYENQIENQYKRIKELSNIYLKFDTNPINNINLITGLAGELFNSSFSLYNRLINDKFHPWGQWHNPIETTIPYDTKNTICIDLMNNKESDVYYVNDIPNSKYNSDFFKKYGIVSYIGKVIYIDNIPVGTLCLFFNKEILLDVEDTYLINILSSVIGIEEKRQIENDNIKNQELFLKQLTDTMEDLLWAKDKEGKYLFANKAAKEKLFSPNDPNKNIKGKSDIDLAKIQREIGQLKNITDYHTFGELCADSDKPIIETKSLGRFYEFGNVEGTRLDLDVLKAPLYNSEGEYIGVLGSARDITRDIEIKKELDKKTRLLEAVTESISVLSTYDNWNDAIEGLLTILGTATNSDRTYIFKNEYQNNEIYCSHKNEWCRTNDLKQSNNESLQMICYDREIPRWKSMMLSKGIICDHVINLPNNEKSILESQNIKSLCVVPIFVRNQWWGFIGFDSCTVERYWTNDEKRILETVSHILGGFIFQRELFQETKNECADDIEFETIKNKVLNNINN